MKIYYVYDALCGWCYGFSSVISNFYEQHKEEYPFEVISGGMMLGEREGKIKDVAPFIKDAYKTVEARTGVTFGKPFLKELKRGELRMSSYLPARAMAAFKMTQPDEQVVFAHKIQKAIYLHGKAPTDEETYFEIIKDMEINHPEYKMNLKLEASSELTIHDFQFTQQLKVEGFPSIFIEKNKSFVMIGNGYLPFPQLNENLNRGLKLLNEQEV